MLRNLLGPLCANLSLVDWWPLRAVLLVLAGLALVALVWLFRRRAARFALLGLVIALICVNCLVTVNAYYGYYLTLGQAFGLTGKDQGSLAALNNRRTEPRDGVVVTIDIPGKKSGFRARPAQVYVPPAWFRSPRPKLPVVVLLHGTPGSPTDWLDGGAAKATADAWASSHGGVAPIIAMPDINGAALDDSECVDGPRDHAETYLSTDVPAFMRSRFFADTDRREWAVAGLSEGGSCAIMLALRHPDTYSAFADFGGLAGPRTGDTNDPAGTAEALFHGSRQEFEAHEPSVLLSRGRYDGLHGFFGVGSADEQPLTAARQLADLSRRAGIDTHTTIFPGGEHTFDVWRNSFAAALPWLADQLKPAPRPQATHPRACDGPPKNTTPHGC